ncbi:MAG: hypothetical protein DHS20C15_06460 [Planctomycetota bacterium]|nr:MAG: hypothetical protein DHS20C15_06460 [Planctomycetota bacterium]
MKTLVLAAGLLTALVVGSQGLDAKPQDEEMPMAQPGEQHRMMKAFVGDWDAALTFSSPMGEIQMQGKEKVSMFGAFYQLSEFSGDFMGIPFEGRATMGYDPIGEEWTITWIDTMSPTISIMKGDWDAESKSWTFFHTQPNEAGEIVDMKTVIAIQSDDAHTHTAYALEDDGTEVQQMHIAYTRAKTKPKADGMR